MHVCISIHRLKKLAIKQMLVAFECVQNDKKKKSFALWLYMCALGDGGCIIDTRLVTSFYLSFSSL
jgi:hypothetical protein